MPRTSASPRAVLLACFAGIGVAALDISLVGPGLPAIQAAFGLDERAVSQTFTLYVLFNLIGTPLMSKLAERHGRRPVFVADLLLFAVGSLAVAAAPTFGAVCAARGLVGFASSGLLPIATASIADAFPPERRGRGLGLLGIVYGLAFVLGPLSAGVLLRGSWRALFLLTPPLALAAAALSSRVLSYYPSKSPSDAKILRGSSAPKALAAITGGERSVLRPGRKDRAQPTWGRHTPRPARPTKKQAERGARNAQEPGLRACPAPWADRGEPIPFDRVGLGLLATGLASMALAFQHLDTAAPGQSLRSAAVLPFALAAAVLLPLFWRREHRAPNPIVRPEMLKSRAARMACAFAFGSGMGEAGLVFLPGLAIAALAVTKAQASFLLLPVVLAVGVGAPVSGLALDRFGNRPVIFGGLALVGAGFLGLAELAGTRGGFCAGSTVLGLGLATVLGAPVRAIFLAAAGPGERVASQAAFNVFANGGRLSSAALVGAITSSAGGGVGGYAMGYRALAGIMVALTVLAIWLPRRSSAQEPPISV